MKWFSLVFVVALGALAAAGPAWTPGKTYVYQYKTRTATGIPELRNQVGAVGLRAQVSVEVASPSELLVQLQDIAVARAENAVLGNGYQQWRKEIPLSYEPLQESQELATPFKILIREGQVQGIETAPQESQWALNIKRSLASQLSLNILKIQQKRTYTAHNAISKESEEFFTVSQEPSVLGNCQTHYSIVPLPAYIAQSEQRDLPQQIKSKYEGQPAFIVTKTRDLTYCTEKPAFIHSSVVDDSEDGSSPSDSQHKRFSSRTSVSRYLVLGEPMHKFAVERVWSEGEYVVKPFATNTESIFISANQTLVLEKEEQASGRIALPSNLIRRELIFEMVQKNHQNKIQYSEEEEYSQYQNDEDYNNNQYQSAYEQEDKMDWEQKQKYGKQYYQRISPDSEEYPTLKQAPKIILQSRKQVPIKQVQQQIMELLKKVESSIEQLDQISEQEPQLKMVQIARAITVLNFEEIEEVYQMIHAESRSAETKKSNYLDAVAMAGTNPAVMFLIEKIQKREVQGETAAQLIMVLPNTVKTPTPELLRQLVNLCQATKTYQNKQVWYTALLSTATLLNRACINPMTRRHNWAVSPLTQRPYCGPQEVRIFLPYLKKELQVESQNPNHMIVLVQAVGNLGAPESYDTLRPIISGQSSTDKQVRSKAIFALGRLLQAAAQAKGQPQYPYQQVREQIRSQLMPIYNSPVEQSEVRLAAFVTILKSKPSQAFYNEAATGTWFEPSQQVGQFVYSTLAALANCTFPTHQNASGMAQMALPLAKKYELGFQYSQNKIYSHVIPERRIGSSLNMAHFGGKHSVFPEQLYASLKNHLGGFDIPMFEGAIQAQGIQKFINKFFESEMKQELKLDQEIQTRKDLPTQINLWFKAMGNMERIITLDTLRQWSMEGFIKFEGGNRYSVNYQKTIPLQDTDIIMPIESGFPIYLSKKTPLFVSLRGNIELDVDFRQMAGQNELPKQFKIKFDLTPIVSASKLLEVGVISPVTKEVFLTGHKTNVAMTLPGKVNVEYKNKELEIRAERKENIPSKIQLISFKAEPYTAQAGIYDFVQKNMKSIVEPSRRSHKQWHLMEKTLGLAMESSVQMETPYLDFAGLWQQLQPHNALTAAQFLAVPHTLRQIRFHLNLDLARSETKALKAKISYNQIKKAFSLRDMQEEERLQRQYYKHQSQYFLSSWERAQKYFQHGQIEVPEQFEEQQYRQQEQAYAVRNPELRRRYEQEEEIQINAVEARPTPLHSVHVEIELEGQSTRRYRTSVVLAGAERQVKQKFSVLLEREAASHYGAWYLRLSGQVQYPRVPAHRQQILQSPMTALGHFEMEFGTPEKPSKAHFRVRMEQTPEWRRQAQTSERAQECQKYEQEGSPYAPVCKEARREAQALNKLVMEAEFDNNTPRQIRNMTYHMDDFLKAALYHHMSNKQLGVQNSEKKITVVFDIKPVTFRHPYQVLDVYMFKPRENTFYQAIKMSPVAEAFFPINAELPTYAKGINKLAGYQLYPTCELSRQWIQTFDNVSYQYPLSECYHLVAKDCSKAVPVEVLAKQDGQGKKAKIHLGQQVVEILSSQEVQLNGQSIAVELYKEKAIQSQDKPEEEILIVSRPKAGKLVVASPYYGVQVKTDGKHLQVQMSNIYRGRVCGLCGDMNYEKTAELKDPQGCVRQSAQQFGRSYLVDESCTSAPRAEPLDNCIREYTVVPYASAYGSGYAAGSASSSYSNSGSGIKYVNKVVPRGEETCFSVKPVPECSIGTMPTAHVTKEVAFHCVHRGRVANEMVARSRNAVLEELFGKTEDFSQLVAVPEACQAIEAY